MLLFRGEEATQARGGHNPFLDAAELQRWPNWTQLLHVQPSGRAIEVVLVFLGLVSVQVTPGLLLSFVPGEK